MFAYDEVLLDEALFPVPPPMYVVGNEAGKIEKVDESTVRFTFVVPNSLFVRSNATPYAGDLLRFPRHYMEQFHEKHNPDVEELAKKEKLGGWAELFLLRADPRVNKELPRLHPWLPLNVFGEGTRYRDERNPYYFKVDPEGSQLPYIDRLIYRHIAEPQVMVLAASNGEIDMQDRTINTMSNKPVLARGREDGGYEFFDEIPSDSNACVIRTARSSTSTPTPARTTPRYGRRRAAAGSSR